MPRHITAMRLMMSALIWVFFVEQLKRSLGLFIHRCLGKLFFHLNAITHWNP